MKIVLDTNALINAIGLRSQFSILLDAFEEEIYTMCVNTEILFEYEEMLPKFFSRNTYNQFWTIWDSSVNKQEVSVRYKFNLSSDPDDNKFVDVYLAANADILLSNDKALLALTQLTYPPINVMRLKDFAQLLSEQNTGQ